MLKFEKLLPIGLQMYSVRDYASKDLEGTLKAVKEMGYDYVEPEWLYGKTAEEYKAILDRCGLRAACMHATYADIVADTEKVIADCKTLGVRYAAIPYLMDDDRPLGKNYEDVLANIARCGRIFAENGIKLLYHNHDFEFVRMPDGRYGFDHMYDTVSADHLASEMDTCWVNVAGEDPGAYIRKYAGRAPVVHLKDFVMPGKKPAKMYALIGIDDGEGQKDEEAFSFRPVGYGAQRVEELLLAAAEAGSSWLIVEQDAPSLGKSPLECAKMSRHHLKELMN